ncbi:condensation domain-containing protein [Streptomyces lydicus]|uniref:condensation domain-containing protein n=1 Tax=Streptomyces lydicus TaxID=47763 RepID=UPI003678A6FC
MHTDTSAAENLTELGATIAQLAFGVLATPVDATTDLPAAGLELNAAIRLMISAYENAGAVLTVTDIYAGRTPQGIADRIRRRVPLGAGAASAPSESVTDGWLQIWREEAARAAGPGNVVSLAYLGTADSEIATDRLTTSLAMMAIRQAALRTMATGADGGTPRPVILPSLGRPRVTTVTVPDAGWEALQQALDLAAAGSREGIDTVRGPLVRCVLYKWNGGLLLAVHLHRSVLDPWSLETFERELESSYAATCAPDGDAARNAITTTWQPADPSSAHSASDWQARVRAVAPLTWPVPAQPDPADSSTADWSVLVDDALLAGLRATTRMVGISLTSLVFTAYARGLAEFTGATDFCVGLAVSGRVKPWQETALGHNTITVPVQVRIVPGEPLASLLRRCDQAALRSVDNRWFGLTEESKAGPGHVPAPLFQTSLCVEPQEPARMMRLGAALLTPMRLPKAAPSIDLTAELLRSTRPDGGRQLLLTSDPARIGPNALSRLGEAVHTALVTLAEKIPPGA